MQRFTNFVQKLSQSLSFNKATLSGALDVIVIRHPDGSMQASPFFVRFGKLKLLISKEQDVKIRVNGQKVNIRMKLSGDGEGYFVHQNSPSMSPMSKRGLPPYRLSPVQADDDSIDSQEQLTEVWISLCKTQLPNQDAFFDNMIDHGQFQLRPYYYLDNKELVFKIGNEIYDWDQGIPEIISLLAFGRSLLQETEDDQDEQFHLQLSLCKSQISVLDWENTFDANAVSFEDFSQYPWGILSNPELVIKLGDQIYQWRQSLPHIISLLVYQKPLFQQYKKNNKYKRGYENLRLTSFQLHQLNLRQGMNIAQYTVRSKIQGKQTIQGKIFLWDWNSKIVISDIDGTITKSDVLGHVLPLLGKDWSHPGVVGLYQNIQSNGYKFLYLSSRPIGQAKYTKEYLENLKQNDNSLPDGPVLVSSDRMLKSFFREIIHKTPHNFKASLLNDINYLFPTHINPFYAGFGNKETDALSYVTSGVPIEMVFIVNPTGQLRMLHTDYVTSYDELNLEIADLFPTY